MLVIPHSIMTIDINGDFKGGLLSEHHLRIDKVKHFMSSLLHSMVSPSNILRNPSFEQVSSASSPDGAYINVPTDPGSSYLTDTRCVSGRV